MRTSERSRATPRGKTPSGTFSAVPAEDDPAANLPGKLFYKIGEVSRLTGLEAYVLRYWETEFPFLHPRKSAGGQRVYLKKDVELVLEIKRMLYEQGYTIMGAKKKLQERTPERTPPPHLIGTIKGQLQAILDDLKAFDKPSHSIGA